MAINKKKTVLNDFADKSRKFRANRFLSNKKVVFAACSGLFILIPIAIIFVYSMGVYLVEMLTSIGQMKTAEFSLHLPSSPVFYLVVVLLALLAIARVAYEFRTSYSDFAEHSRDSERWAYLEELYEQYPSVPAEADFFPGKGGVPIAWDRAKNRILIDPSSVNNYIIGTTRSGKGEAYMFTALDIYSRAEEKSSLIVTDPKLELYKSAYQTMTERGYTCLVLNLSDPGKSMSFNPLQLIIDAWKAKDIPSAELLSASFAYSIFSGEDGGSGDNQFWSDTSTNLLSALIIAHVQDCLELDAEYNKMEEHKFKNRQRLFEGYDESLQDAIRASHEGKSYDEILAERATPIPSEMEYIPSRRHEKQITMYSIINTFQTLAQMPYEKRTALDVYFERRPMRDRAKLKYIAANVAGDETKGSIYATMITKLVVFTYENIAKMTAENNVNLLDIGFGEKPYAIFISTPDYDSSNHFIASVFIRQMYFCLAQHCANYTTTGKCRREVVFLLDEFGNLPVIENMANAITVCLGRNIRFNLLVQSNAQIEKLYGKDTETIIGNCGNQYFLSSGDFNTCKSFSEALGKESIIKINRTGEKFAFRKSFTEMEEKESLMSPNELQHLNEGEIVIKRIMQRKDLKGQDMVQAPILNTGEQRFRYRYQYLLPWFPSGEDIHLDTIPWQDTTAIDLDDHVYDINAHFGRLSVAMDAEKAAQREAMEKGKTEN